MIPRSSIGEFAVAAPMAAPLRGKNGELVEMFCAHPFVVSIPPSMSNAEIQKLRLGLFIKEGVR